MQETTFDLDGDLEDRLDVAHVRNEAEARLFGTASTDPPTVGRFIIKSRLGEGGMGRVYAATDPELRRVVAVKLLSRDDPTALLAEARAMAKLAHPNVVAVHEVGTHEGRGFIAMEQVKGGTLRGWCGGQSWADILNVYLQVGQGLAAAHAAGLVHRDFKPDNVLMGEDGRPRVTDFGLARPTNSKAAAAGTPAYMAPEQHRKDAATPNTDQFAYCAALWEALYGQRPFRGDVASVYAAKRAGPPSVPRSLVPGYIGAVLRRGLSPDSANRWPSLNELMRELDRDPVGARMKQAMLFVLAVFLVITLVGSVLQAVVFTDYMDRARSERPR